MNRLSYLFGISQRDADHSQIVANSNVEGLAQLLECQNGCLRPPKFQQTQQWNMSQMEKLLRRSRIYVTMENIFSMLQKVSLWQEMLTKQIEMMLFKIFFPNKQLYLSHLAIFIFALTDHVNVFQVAGANLISKV